MPRINYEKPLSKIISTVLLIILEEDLVKPYCTSILNPSENLGMLFYYYRDHYLHHTVITVDYMIGVPKLNLCIKMKLRGLRKQIRVQKV